MDNRKFDQLARLVGKGASRRSILKGLLGLGGAAVVGGVATERVDARTVGTRPTIPPPVAPGCILPRQMCDGICCDAGKCKDGHCCPSTTDVWCGGSCCSTGLCTATGECCAPGDDVCGTICCPPPDSAPQGVTLCARSGNTDFCCDGGRTPCGLDCCSEFNQCCDGECCASGHVCLTQVFEEGPFVEEEVCCLESQTCDNRCCDGVCFLTAFLGDSPFEGGGFFDRECCPAGGTVCVAGEGPFEGFARCCQGETPDCCVRTDGQPICIETATQCCEDDECPDDPQTCRDGDCLREVQTCGFTGEINCPDGEECCTGGDNVCCPASIGCCGPLCCGDGLECCERTISGVQALFCIVSATQCCNDSECDVFDDPVSCLEGVCSTDGQTCIAASTCADGESCCEGNAEFPGVCITTAQCCSDGDCNGCQSCIENSCSNDCDPTVCCDEVDDADEWFCRTGDCCPGGKGCESGSCCFAEGGDSSFCLEPGLCCPADGCDGLCEFCNESTVTCEFDCLLEDTCCGETALCNQATGECELCGGVDDDCSDIPFLPCCGELICTSFTCQTCFPIGTVGCESVSECCDDGSTWCRAGLCSCSQPGGASNSCTRDDGACCDGFVCVSTTESGSPLNGMCGTTCIAEGSPCQAGQACCAGNFCATFSDGSTPNPRCASVCELFGVGC